MKIEFKELNPVIQGILEDMTDGLDLMESARLRKTAIERIAESSLLGIITPQAVCQICIKILEEDCQRIEKRLYELEGV